MGKPSITNIKPPSSTTVWTPSTSSWDLNGTDWTDFKSHGWGADNGDSNYAGLTDKVNTNEASAITVTHDQLAGYGYVFMGVNGGSDETIIGKTNAAGIIVSGNGADHITGGNLGDQIWAGNGKDVVHGGGGNDIIFGENGADQLFGDGDNGTATVTPGQDTRVLVLKAGADLWDHDPDGETADATTPKNTTVSKEPDFISVDSNGHPTELDGQGNPIIHVVYSITPDATGDYTLAYTQGNGLDGDGNPDFPGPSDQMQVHLEAGKTYYYSFTYDPGHSTVRVDVFGGHITVTGDNSQDPTAVATSQGLPEGSWQAYFTTENIPGVPTLTAFEAGDQLIGGNGPDTFTWDAADGPKNVDLVWDYNQGSGTYDATEGDTLVLKGTGLTDNAQLTTYNNLDLDGDGNKDLVIYLSADHAIGLVGITDVSQVNIAFA